MATDSNGVANVVYVAGTGLGTVKVYVRPYGIDAATASSSGRSRSSSGDTLGRAHVCPDTGPARAQAGPGAL